MLASHATDPPSDPTRSDEPTGPRRPGDGRGRDRQRHRFRVRREERQGRRGREGDLELRRSTAIRRRAMLGRRSGGIRGPRVDAAGSTFEQTFNRPGRFTYVCEPHQTLHEGHGHRRHGRAQEVAVEVLPVAARQHGDLQVHARRGRQGVDQASGARQSARRRASGSGAGKHSIKLRNMEPGKYNGTATFTDDFGKRSVVKISTVVR